MKKQYIILGDNNFWYSTTGEITEKELASTLKDLKKEIKAGSYNDQVDTKPNELFVYEAKEVQRVKL